MACATAVFKTAALDHSATPPIIEVCSGFCGSQGIAQRTPITVPSPIGSLARGSCRPFAGMVRLVGLRSLLVRLLSPRLLRRCTLALRAPSVLPAAPALVVTGKASCDLGMIAKNVARGAPNSLHAIVEQLEQSVQRGKAFKARRSRDGRARSCARTRRRVAPQIRFPSRTRAVRHGRRATVRAGSAPCFAPG